MNKASKGSNMGKLIIVSNIRNVNMSNVSKLVKVSMASNIS